jgi:hypothetical protein
MLYLRVDESTICMKGEARRRRDKPDLPAPDRRADPADTSAREAAFALLACRVRAREA